MQWKESKDAGKQAFSEGKYSDALSCYSEAIRQLLLASSGSSHRTNEHQVLLSNAIACRLKIGGEDMVEKAVEEAKTCIALNNQWSKAHVRLASAYIALGGHSNDACLSLQRALSLDRSNKVAREMLVKEMRSRNNRERNGDSGSNQEERNGSSSSASQRNGDAHYHPTEETPHRHYPSPSAPPEPSQSTNNNDSNNDGIDVDDIEPPDAYYSLTFYQRIQHHFAQFITWFYSQSDDIQTLLKVAVCFLILYVALGGRFGLDYALGGNNNRIGRQGNYGEGNAYDKYSSTSSSPQNKYSSSSDQYHDRYANEKQQQQTGNSHGAYDQQRQTSSGYNDRTNSQNDRHYSRYKNDDYQPPRRRSNTSYQMPNLYDGSLASMAILLVIGIVCHRFGINPFQAIWMLNLMRRRGGHQRMGGFGYGAYQGGGFGRFGRRGRGGFY